MNISKFRAILMAAFMLTSIVVVGAGTAAAAGDAPANDAVVAANSADLDDGSSTHTITIHVDDSQSLTSGKFEGDSTPGSNNIKSGGASGISLKYPSDAVDTITKDDIEAEIISSNGAQEGKLDVQASSSNFNLNNGFINISAQSDVDVIDSTDRIRVTLTDVDNNQLSDGETVDLIVATEDNSDANAADNQASFTADLNLGSSAPVSVSGGSSNSNWHSLQQAVNVDAAGNDDATVTVSGPVDAVTSQPVTIGSTSASDLSSGLTAIKPDSASSGLTIKGSTGSETVSLNGDGNDLSTVNLDPNGHTGLTVQDLTFDVASITDNKDITAIPGTTTQDLTIDDNTFKDIDGTNTINALAADAGDLSITDNKFEENDNTRTILVGEVPTSSGTSIDISGNVFGTGVDGYSDVIEINEGAGNGNVNVDIADNVVNEGRGGDATITISRSTLNVNQLNVTNNTIDLASTDEKGLELTDISGGDINISENDINTGGGSSALVQVDAGGTNSLLAHNNTLLYDTGSAGGGIAFDLTGTASSIPVTFSADSTNPAVIGGDADVDGINVDDSGVDTDNLAFKDLRIVNVDAGIDAGQSGSGSAPNHGLNGDVGFYDLNITNADGSQSIVLRSQNSLGTVRLNDTLIDGQASATAVEIGDGGNNNDITITDLELVNNNVTTTPHNTGINIVENDNDNLAITNFVADNLEFNGVSNGLIVTSNSAGNTVLESAGKLEVTNVTADDVSGTALIQIQDANARDAVVDNVTATNVKVLSDGVVDIEETDPTGGAKVTNIDVSGDSADDSNSVVKIGGNVQQSATIDAITADNTSQVVTMAVGALNQPGSSIDITNVNAQDLTDSDTDAVEANGNARTITVKNVDLDQIGSTNGIAVNGAEGDVSQDIVITGSTINATSSQAINFNADTRSNLIEISNATLTNVSGSNVIAVDNNQRVRNLTIASVTMADNDAKSIDVRSIGDGPTASAEAVTIRDSTIGDNNDNDAVNIGQATGLDVNRLNIRNIVANSTNDAVDLTGFTSAADVQITNIEATNATNAGVVVNDGTANNVNVTQSTFDDNNKGVDVAAGGGDPILNVTNNDFFSHGSQSVHIRTGSLDAANVDVSRNFWNATSGPTVVDNEDSSISRYALGGTLQIENNVLSSGSTSDITQLPWVDANDNVVRAATGQLTDPSGNGIADQEVTFSLTDVDTGNNKTVTFSELSNSNDAGTSQDGDYVIAAETGTTDFVTFDVTASTAGFAETDTNRFTLGNDEFLTTGFDLQANDAAQINGTATGPSGDALTNTQLQVLDAASGDQLATATTDSDGVFTFDVSPLSSDTVFINDTAGTFPDSSEATVTVDTGEQVNQSFTLGGQLNGTVFFPNETATDNTEIDFTVNNGAETVVSTTTDENGSYTVDITAREGSDGARDYTLQAENSSFDPSDATDVTITEGEVTTQNFTLKSLNTATLTATIQNGTSGEALTDTEVTLTAGDNAPGSLNATRTTDSNGQITLRIPASDPPTAYDITANADGFSSASVGFAPAAGESVSRTFTVEEAADEQPPTATVTFGGEDGLTVVNGSTSVNVASARFDGTEDFVIVVHRASPGDNGVVDGPSEINAKIGSSDVLSGNVSDVSVNLTKNLDEDGNTQLTENQTLVAMLHFANESRPGDRNFDTSIKRSGSPVFDQADITIVDAPRVGGSENPAGNTDEDAQLEDVDGDGDAGFNDAIVLATNLDDPGVEDNPQFDFDGDGDVDFNDAIVLATS